MARSKPLRQYVAFLRGINVGGHRVKMDPLRALFEELKLADVSTFIASGNVIFKTADTETARLEPRIEAHLRKALGYEVATFLRTPAQLAAVAAFQPFADGAAETPGHTVHVAFLRAAPGDTLEQSLPTFRTAVDDFRLHGSELYWLCRVRSNESLVKWPLLAKAIAGPSTMRNMTMIRKLVAKYRRHSEPGGPQGLG